MSLGTYVVCHMSCESSHMVQIKPNYVYRQHGTHFTSQLEMVSTRTIYTYTMITITVDSMIWCNKVLLYCINYLVG